MSDVVAQAEWLRELAARVRRLSPCWTNPEKFYLDRSDLAHDLDRLADGIAPGIVASRMERSKGRGKKDVGTEVVNGRRVTVQHKRPSFRISV